MKKLLAILMALSAVFLFSCSNESSDSGNSSDSENTNTDTNGTSSSGQTVYTNTITASTTTETVEKHFAIEKPVSYTYKFLLNFPADDDTYFYKCFSGLKDNYEVSCTENDYITLPDPKAYYLQFKKSDNSLVAVYRAPYSTKTEWQGGKDNDDDDDVYTYTTDEQYDASTITGSGDNEDTLTFVYSSEKTQIINLYNNSTFEWDGKSAVYLYHSSDCKETYSVIEDNSKIIKGITDYFVIFDGEAYDNSENPTAKIQLNGTDKIVTITCN